MSHRYANPWHKRGEPQYGPPVYECETEPIEHAGYLIYRRRPDCCDVVLNGECVTQRATLKGAKEAAEMYARLAAAKRRGQQP